MYPAHRNVARRTIVGPSLKTISPFSFLKFLMPVCLQAGLTKGVKRKKGTLQYPFTAFYPKLWISAPAGLLARLFTAPSRSLGANSGDRGGCCQPRHTVAGTAHESNMIPF